MGSAATTPGSNPRALRDERKPLQGPIYPSPLGRDRLLDAEHDATKDPPKSPMTPVHLGAKRKRDELSSGGTPGNRINDYAEEGPAASERSTPLAIHRVPDTGAEESTKEDHDEDDDIALLDKGSSMKADKGDKQRRKKKKKKKHSKKERTGKRQKVSRHGGR